MSAPHRCFNCGALCTLGSKQIFEGCFNEDVICPKRGVIATISTNTEERAPMKKKSLGKHAAAAKNPNGKVRDTHQPDPAAAREARNDGERAQRFKRLEALERRAQLKYSAYLDLKEATSDAKEEYDSILTEIRAVIRGEDQKPILDLAETSAPADLNQRH